MTAFRGDQHLRLLHFLIVCRSCPSRSVKPPARTGKPCPWTPRENQNRSHVSNGLRIVLMYCYVYIMFLLRMSSSTELSAINKYQYILNTIYRNACIKMFVYLGDLKMMMMMTRKCSEMFCWDNVGLFMSLHSSPSLEFLSKWSEDELPLGAGMEVSSDKFLKLGYLTLKHVTTSWTVLFKF